MYRHNRNWGKYIVLSIIERCQECLLLEVLLHNS